MEKEIKEYNFEDEVLKFRKINGNYLNHFRRYLRTKCLTKSTINNHAFNVEFYINDFLPYRERLEIKAGCYLLDEYLGKWFLKVSWTCYSAIKNNARSIKKFYQFLLLSKIIKEKDFLYLCKTINEKLEEWLDNYYKQFRGYEFKVMI